MNKRRNKQPLVVTELSEIEKLHPFTPQQKIFRAYDIRGEYRYFTNDFMHALANSLVAFYETEGFTRNTVSNDKGNDDSKIVIGYDMRQGSLKIAQQIASAFVNAGFEVLWLGMVTTPIMAYWATEQKKEHQNGIMVTASHSSKNIAGIKWIAQGHSPTGTDIQAVFQNMAHQPLFSLSNEQLIQQWQDCLDKLTPINSPEFAYLQGIDEAVTAIQSDFQNKILEENKLVSTIVIDCLHGTTARFAKVLFSKYAKNVIVLNGIPNGDFPKGNPDPCEEGRLEELHSAVICYQADLGLAFDGDGDRMVVVDNIGNVIDPDNLLFLLAKTALSRKVMVQNPHDKSADQKPEVIFDVKCSHHLANMLNELGAIPVMSKTGSSHMRHSMQTGSSKAVFAGELSGHFIYNDGLFINHDDGMYAGVRLLIWLSQQSQSLSDIVNELPTMVSTADTYINIEEHQSLIKRLIGMLKDWLHNTAIRTLPVALNNRLPKDARLSTIDGIRLDFESGFGVIRQSNTSQSLTVRFAGDALADLKKIQQYFVKICQQLDEKLAKAVSQIEPVVH